MGLLKFIETYIATADQLADDGIPSASMAMLENPNEPIQAHVIGRAKENADTVYQACSISKAITALAVARLVDLGKLTYDTKVVEVLEPHMWKDVVDGTTVHLMQYVTVGQLLSHRSGLSQHGFDGYTGHQPTYEQVFAGSPPSNTPRLRFLSFPGSQFDYSGGGYTLLQVLLETLLGQPFAEVVQATVFAPLKMSRSHYGDLLATETNYAKAHLTAYTPGTEMGRGYHIFVELAAAGLWTTPTDLLRAVSAIQISLHTTTGFLTQATAQTMLTSSIPRSGSFGQWSYGWGICSTFFAHSGSNNPGYECYVIGSHALTRTIPPAGGIHSPGLMSVAIMTNSALGRPTLKKLLSAIFCLKPYPIYETLPGAFGKMTDYVPYPSPEGVLSNDTWPLFVGEWSRCDTTQIPSITLATAHSTSPSGQTPTPSSLFVGLAPGEYEIFGDNDVPYIIFDGIELPHRLRHGCTPWQRAGDKKPQALFVVDGLEMAVRMMWAEDTEDQMMELIVGGEVVPLHRA